MGLIINWIQEHYKIVAGVFLPIIVAIIGIFRFSKNKITNNSKITISGDNNTNEKKIH
jgi:hypothetical protein